MSLVLNRKGRGGIDKFKGRNEQEDSETKAHSDAMLTPYPPPSLMAKPKPLRFQLPMRSLCMMDELYWGICEEICLLRQDLLDLDLTSI